MHEQARFGGRSRSIWFGIICALTTICASCASDIIPTSTNGGGGTVWPHSRPPVIDSNCDGIRDCVSEVSFVLATDLEGDASCEAYFSIVFALDRGDVEEFLSIGAAAISDQVGFDGAVSFRENGLTLEQVKGLFRHIEIDENVLSYDLEGVVSSVFPEEYADYLAERDFSSPSGGILMKSSVGTTFHSFREMFWNQYVNPHLEESTGFPIYQLDVMFDGRSQGLIRVGDGPSQIDGLIRKRTKHKGELGIATSYSLGFFAPRYMHQLEFSLVAKTGPTTVAFDVLGHKKIRGSDKARWAVDIQAAVVDRYNEFFGSPDHANNPMILLRLHRTTAEIYEYNNIIEYLANDCENYWLNPPS